MNAAQKHLKAHIVFYLGLGQLVLGWIASTDFETLTLPAVAVSVSGLLALAIKYVQANLPDESDFPTQPAAPAQSATGATK